MFDVKYYKDYRHNYLIIDGKNDFAENTYQKKMITGNQIKGLLTCQERHINGDTLLYYEITSRQSLLQVYSAKSMGIKDIRQLFIQLKIVNDLLQKYLLYENNLILHPEFILLNVETEEYNFLYYPSTQEASFHLLMEFLVARVDNEDTEAVDVVYKIADLVQRDLFAVDEILNWFPDEAKQENIIAASANLMEMNTERYQGRIPCPVEIPYVKKKRSFREIIQKFFKNKKQNEPNFFDTTEPFVQTADIQEQVPNNDYGNTVFIPWTESCENKLYGMNKGNKYHIDLGHLPITVGKLAGAVDMIIKDQSISRMHARFFRDKNSIYISDLNSTNGTFRNGMRLEPNASILIEPGDEIRLGKLNFIYR